MRNKKRTFIIAEIGNLHEGSVSLAKQIIKSAIECGADAVKLQTHIFEAESLPDAPNPPYFKEESRGSYFKRTAFNLEEYRELKRFCEKLGGKFISSPFSIEAIELLTKVGLEIFKVPSGEVSNVPYLEKLAKTKKKILLSSGMSSWEELDVAVRTLRENGCQSLTILQCTSKYPCPPEEAGLNVISELKKRYKLPVGFSDHTLGYSIPIAAVVLGAEVIEKHFTLSRLMYGSDAKFSMEPAEFKILVNEIRNLEKGLNHKVNKDLMAKRLKNMKTIFEKSIVAARNLKRGIKIKDKDLAYKKPGDGILAKDYKKVIGKVLKKDVKKDYKFKWQDFE